MPSSKRAADDEGHHSSNAHQRQKKYHRRSVWACDECRLRKIKCDGADPCQHCVEIKKVCSHVGRVRPALAPTQRIRVLEDTLRAVRSAIDDLQRTPHLTNANLEQIVSILDGSRTPSSDLEDTPRSTQSIPVLTPAQQNGDFRLPERHLSKPLSDTRKQTLPRSWSYASGRSMIYRLTNLFAVNGSLSSQVISETDMPQSEQLFDSPISVSREYVELPPDEVIVELHTTALNRVARVYPVVAPEELQSLLDDRTSQSSAAALHAICALGCLADHPNGECRQAVDVAWAHYVTAESYLDISQCDGLAALQAILCLALFNMSTCHLWRAHTLGSIALAWVSQLGLHLQTTVRAQHFASESTSSHLVTISQALSRYLCSILGLPVSKAEDDTQSFPSYAHTPLSRNGSLVTPTGVSANSRLRHQLFQVLSNGLAMVYIGPFDSPSNDGVDLGKLGEVEGKTQGLVERALSTIMYTPSAQTTARAKAEVEMTAYACQLQLYTPFLRHLVTMADGSFTPRSRSQRVLACIKTASKTISLCEALMQQNALEPASWFQTYTLFLAVLTLLFLIAAHKGTTQPSQAWSKGEVGIRLLAAMRCSENSATRCLAVIRALVERLSHTVAFDVDQIERTTPTICSHHHGGASRHRLERRPPTTIAAIINREGNGDEYVSPYAGNERPQSSTGMPTMQTFTADEMLAKADDFVLFAAGDDFHFGSI